MTKRVKLITLLCSILVVVISLTTVTIYSYASYRAENKAIIILPGLFASGLYDSVTGDPVWDPFADLDLNFSDFMNDKGEISFNNIAALLSQSAVTTELNKILANNGSGTEDSIINKIGFYEDGTPVVDTITYIPWDNPNRIKYGVINAQKDMYFSLYEGYGDDYDVQIFNYDFRMDNRTSAEQLEEYINAKGYTEVILVSHSNGGQVAALYLARSEENRQKVKKYISYNSPYYGSFDAIFMLENAKEMLSLITDELNKIPLLSTLSGKLEAIFDNQVTSLLNVWPVYQLLPSYELLSTEYNGEQAMIYLDDEPIVFNSETELWEFYCSRPWAKMSNGELKPAMAQWLDYKNAQKVTLASGEKVYATTLIDTTYFSGMNKLSTNKVYYTTNVDETVSLTDKGFTTDGDGIVLLSSAVALLGDSTKIVLVPDIDHYGVNTNYYGISEADTRKEIDAYITDNETWHYKFWSRFKG